MANQQAWYLRLASFLTTWAGFVTSISIIIAAAYTTWNVVVRPRDVAVYIRKQDVSFPVALTSRFGRVYNYMLDSCRNRSLDTDAFATMAFMQSINNYWIITLHNQTDNSVKGLVIKVSGVTILGSSSVTGDYLNDSETVALSHDVHFDSTSKIVYLTKIESLHPRANLKLYLWGKMEDLSLWSNVAVTYEGGDARAGEEFTTTGFKAFLCEYLYEILGLFSFVFAVFYWRLARKVDNSVISPTPGISTGAVNPTNPPSVSP